MSYRKCNVEQSGASKCFLTNYPNCTAIQGNLYISGPDITNLQPLNQLTTVSGTLAVYINPQLQNLNGLNAITNVGGSFEASFNNQLNNISAMQNLTTTGNALILVYNPMLLSLDGLQGLTTVSGLMSIKNMAVANLNGLNNLSSIGFFMEISNNPNLTSVSALMNLNNVSGYIDMQNNPSLTTLSGLDNINPNSITAITVRNSPNLSFCSVASFCDYLDHVGSGTFTNNAIGCSAVSQIQNICSNLSIEDLQAETFAIYPNPVSETLHVKSHDKIKFIQITDISGKIVLQQSDLNTNTIETGQLLSGVYFLSAQIGDNVHKGKFLKQ